MSDLIRQQGQAMRFDKNAWVILNPIEQSIKAKIEAKGTPLKDWDISIYRGILTGCNEAFIISGEKRKELIAKDAKNVEIIRPILRGRDIKRYGYEFADLYLIATFPSRHYNIDDFPAVKDYLENFGKDDEEHLKEYGKDCWGKKRLGQTGARGARKKTNNKWFETQDSISYWDDFSRPKIIYPNMTKYLPFIFDTEGFMTNQKCFIITGKNIAYLTAFLNSSLFKFCFRDNFPELQGGTRELSKIFFDKIQILIPDSKINSQFEKLVAQVQAATKEKRETKTLEVEIDNLIFDLYGLSQKEKDAIGFIEIK